MQCVLKDQSHCSDTIDPSYVPDVFAPAKTLPRLSVKGNRIVDPDGNAVALKGLGLADLDQLLADGHWNAQYFQKAREWGAQVVRIPVVPNQFRMQGPANFLRLLDQGVAWAEQNGMYVILDWQAVGDPVAGVYDNWTQPANQSARQEIARFWSIVATHYRNDPAVAFYELFSQPVNYVDSINGPNMPAFTTSTWTDWKGMAEQIVDGIRERNPDAIVMVTGFWWANDLSLAGSFPIERDSVVYDVQPWPWVAQDPTGWEMSWGYLADSYPIFATAVGFDSTYDPGDSWAWAGVDFGAALTGYLAGKNAGWTAATFHPTQMPSLLSDWDFTPKADQGVFFQCVLQGGTGCVPPPPPPPEPPPEPAPE